MCPQKTISRAKVPLKCNFANKSALFPQAAPCSFSILGRTLTKGCRSFCRRRLRIQMLFLVRQQLTPSRMRHSNVGEAPTQDSLLYISGVKSGGDSKDQSDLSIVRARLTAARYVCVCLLFKNIYFIFN